ncbi:hypothetical protein Ahy_A03g012439 [Arachis hypogaea]|uniref:Uncharacterized protein n=1 Tax=Arachis hypogaea TaxID=3818 RepID=A0A445DTD9_ARAHY|nr:hypothetical protein Ahy_A03g012439 [Arachis hypogaea]
MLKVDELTSIHSRGKFACICVELDLRRQIVPSFTTLGKEFKLEYEGIYQICFKRGRYGHKMEIFLDFIGEILSQVAQAAIDGGRNLQNGGEEGGACHMRKPLDKNSINRKDSVMA